jgi:GNAT superfamily N-acetyltransferase
VQHASPSPETWHLRTARPDDAEAIVALVHDLAEFERATEPPALRADTLRDALFGPRALAAADVAVLDGSVVGVAVWFPTFSTWTGTPGIHLEDLFVQPIARRLGVGRALVAGLARRCAERGWSRLEWTVLDWNASAHRFYRALGAAPLEEWDLWRLDGEALAQLARD